MCAGGREGALASRRLSRHRRCSNSNSNSGPRDCLLLAQWQAQRVNTRCCMRPSCSIQVRWPHQLRRLARQRSRRCARCAAAVVGGAELPTILCMLLPHTHAECLRNLNSELSKAKLNHLGQQLQAQGVHRCARRGQLGCCRTLKLWLLSVGTTGRAPCVLIHTSHAQTCLLLSATPAPGATCSFTALELLQRLSDRINWHVSACCASAPPAAPPPAASPSPADTHLTLPSVSRMASRRGCVTAAVHSLSVWTAVCTAHFRLCCACPHAPP